jgi:hypothetical protein
MANALVVHKDRLPQSQKMLRAAQYVRMSTDYQRYSIENQAAVIAAYAQVHELSIVRTYRDAGESGLTIKNRRGLTQLLNDVRSGHADFDHVLVFDVTPTNRHRRARASGPKRANRRLIHRSKRYCCRPDRSGPVLAAARQKANNTKIRGVRQLTDVPRTRH